MKAKYIFIAIILLSLLSCKSDDGIDSSQILKEYTEPPLNFLISKEQFKEENGIPDIETTKLKYFSSIDGELERLYDFLDNQYHFNNVFFKKNQPNIDFLLSRLTQIYGSSEFFEGVDIATYQWTTTDYTISLNYHTDNENTDELFIAYRYNF